MFGLWLCSLDKGKSEVTVDFSDEALCLRCGQCCHWKVGEELRRCRFLGPEGCEVYDKRLGLGVEAGFTCGLRVDSHFDYEDCPYNTDKPIRLWKFIVEDL